MESGSDGEPEISEDFQAEFREENPFSYMQEENDDDTDGTEVLPLRFTIKVIPTFCPLPLLKCCF